MGKQSFANQQCEELKKLDYQIDVALNATI